MRMVLSIALSLFLVGQIFAGTGVAGEGSVLHKDVAQDYYKKGQYDDAVNEYKQWLKKNPFDPEAFLELGQSYVAKGLYKEAVEEYKQALKFYPDYPEAHLKCADAYFALRQRAARLVGPQSGRKATPPRQSGRTQPWLRPTTSWQ